MWLIRSHKEMIKELQDGLDGDLNEDVFPTPAHLIAEMNIKRVKIVKTSKVVSSTKSKTKKK